MNGKEYCIVLKHNPHLGWAVVGNVRYNQRPSASLGIKGEK